MNMNWFTTWVSENKGLFMGLCIGLATAILFLTIGFWQTVLIGVCTGIGGWLGSHPETRTAIGNFVKSWFHGGPGRSSSSSSGRVQ